MYLGFHWLIKLAGVHLTSLCVHHDGHREPACMQRLLCRESDQIFWHLDRLGRPEPPVYLSAAVLHLHGMLAERVSWFQCHAFLSCLACVYVALCQTLKQEGSAYPLVLFSFLMRSMTELCHS